jgi:hypothetical protein
VDNSLDPLLRQPRELCRNQCRPSLMITPADESSF